MATAFTVVGSTTLAACGSSDDKDTPETKKLRELIAKSSTDTTVATNETKPRRSGPVVVALPTGGFAGGRIAIQIEGVVADIRHEQGGEANLEHALISSQPQAGPQGLVDAIVAAREEGRQLDLVFINTTSELQALADAELLVRVQSAATSDPEFDLSNYYSSALDAASFKGQLMALPVWIRPTMVQYSPKAFETAGVEPPDVSWDWPTFVERAARLTVADSVGGKSQYGFIVHPFVSPSFMYMWQNGADVLSSDGKTATVNSQEAIEAVQFMRDLVLKHEVSPRLIGDQVETPSIEFSNDGLVVNGGLIAMIPRQIGGQFGFNIFRALFAGARGTRSAGAAASPGTTPINPVEILSTLPLGPVPKGQVAVNVGETGGMIGVLTGTADVPGAWRELQVLADALGRQGLVPARRMSAETIVELDNSLDISSAAALIVAAEHSRVVNFPHDQQIRRILRQVIDQPVLGGETSATDACNEAARQIDDLLNGIVGSVAE